MSPTFDIFISYRRKDSDGKVSGRDIAARIKNAFEDRGYDVFFDLENIQDGFFDEIIIPAIRTCKVFILILSTDALVRCSNQDDWVRREIKEAIDSGCHIIPINPDGAFEGWPKDLPNEIELIKRIHISEMNMDTIFKESIQHIEETRIRKVAHPKRFPKIQDNNSGKRYNLKIITDTDCIISIDGYDCGICKANKVRVLELPEGSYVLDIVCMEEPIIRNTYDIEVTSNVIKRCSLKNVIEKINSISKFEENGKYGLINKADDEIILRPIYDDIKPFSEGLAAIQLNDKWGFVNKLGRIIVSPQYLHVENFAYGYAKVQKGAKDGFIDKTGKIVIPIKYDFVSPFDENELALVNKDGKYGYINRWGREIIPIEYDDIDFSFYEYLCSAKKDGKYAVVDVKGRLITSFLYDDISRFFGGVAKFKLDDKWGLLNSFGEIIIPNEYEEIDFAYDELVLAKKDGKYGFLSLSNETIIPFEYDSAYIFRDGLAPVCINHRWGYINKQNEKVIPLKYDMATPFSEFGLAVVKINNETHYIDKGEKLYVYKPKLLK